MRLEQLGYNSFFEDGRNRLGFNDAPIARVISEHKEAYRIKNEKGEYLAKITGKQMLNALSREDYPAVGDWVVITELSNARAVIRAILPRMTVIKRRHGDKNKEGEKRNVQVIAANVDVAFVIESVDRDYSVNRFERYFSIAKDGGVYPTIILNKIDLLSREELGGRMRQLKERLPDIDIISTSTVKSDGLSELVKYIAAGKTYCFLGSSGVGKSTLINKLIGENIIRTNEISAHSGRGKHTTTKRQMYFLSSGGIVIDNPGIREVGMTNVSKGINAFFDEIAALAKKCKYTDCAHAREPGCAVIDAVESGELNKESYSNYTDLKEEAAYYEMNDIEKRKKDRQFGKFLKKAKKELKSLGYKG